MVQRVDIQIRAGLGPPTPVLLTVPKPLRAFREWSWRLVRWPSALRPDQLDLAIADEPARPARYARPRRMDSDQGLPISALLFEEDPVVEGSFSLEDDHGDAPHRLVVWSCNQPYETDDSGNAIFNPEMPALLDWAEHRVREFSPHVVWGLGDTAYADGTEATNFVDEFYDRTDLAGAPEVRDELRSAYRRMYRAHWSFPPLQRMMCTTPHLTVWDDHEIRDGWGSEDQDFAGGNPVVLEVARDVAEEFILNNGPRIRPTGPGAPPDAHQAYISGTVACFIFDGRTSRRYSDPDGRVISDDQYADFESFCGQIAQDRRVRFLVMGSAVPFINLKDIVEGLGSQAPKALTDLMAQVDTQRKRQGARSYASSQTTGRPACRSVPALGAVDPPGVRLSTLRARSSSSWSCPAGSRPSMNAARARRPRGLRRSDRAAQRGLTERAFHSSAAAPATRPRAGAYLSFRSTCSSPARSYPANPVHVVDR